MFARLSPIVLAISFASLVSASNVGSGTYYAPGLGACGIPNTASDLIVAASAQFFDTYPGATPNPNNNPICRRGIIVSYQGRSVQAAVTDRCAGCAGLYDIDMSPAVFDQLAPEAVGRIEISWDLI
ncbi:hypothetical protein PLICRDRAFT_179760 [Plicaturopsis crispa FD-325 SS-3]|uniref:RlpA-like protein double-psi beta-barrel domain-containing protein n=1 Tax=Plicaturopsis crispa FD-325 SS-3 TaxID=944288 RepID=A0A0C9T433_PLICR|nr:hypothetical protein PLICRDRAFT_179760 [Plicaturopsis crispa FD-325 SS-3]